MVVFFEKVGFWRGLEGEKCWFYILGFVLRNENRLFGSEKRFFDILGGKNVIWDIVLAPFWHQKVNKNEVQNEVEQKDRKSVKFSSYGVGPAECAGLTGRKIGGVRRHNRPTRLLTPRGRRILWVAEPILGVMETMSGRFSQKYEVFTTKAMTHAYAWKKCGSADLSNDSNWSMREGVVKQN